MAEVWSFEPMAENFSLLRTNTQDLPRVRIQQAALGDRSGTVHAGGLGDNTGGTSVNWSGDGDITAFDVADVFSEWPYVDCIKMDCEGSEFPILTRVASLPGGIRARVGCVRAEVHGPRGSAERSELARLLCEAFPHTQEQWIGDGLSYFYAWR